jgi:beta-glucosidase
MGVDQLAPTYEESVVAAVNAGVDMVMVPFEYRRFIDAVTTAVADGTIPMSRIDDAVRRILRAKLWLRSSPNTRQRPSLDAVGAPEHRRVAAEAARRSAVLLKDDRALPISGRAPILVGGDAADDTGLQCGGWTASWQGSAGTGVPGVTLVGALERATGAQVVYEPEARGSEDEFDVGIVCVAEEPYAEGPGDRAVPEIRPQDAQVFHRMRARCRILVLVVYSGRPVVIPDLIDQADAVIAAWLPGSEATELPDLLLGRSDFEGSLRQPWPMSRGAVEPDGADLGTLQTIVSQEADT